MVIRDPYGGGYGGAHVVSPPNQYGKKSPIVYGNNGGSAPTNVAPPQAPGHYSVLQKILDTIQFYTTGSEVGPKY
jgi:hypothetical protein